MRRLELADIAFHATADVDAIARTVAEHGCAIVQDALPYLMVKRLAEGHASVMDSVMRSSPPGRFGEDRIDHGSGWIEVVRAAEKHPAFEDLMELPLVLRVMVRLLGPTVELASGGEIDLKLRGSADSCAPWHRDSMWIPGPVSRDDIGWVWCFYFVDDVDVANGPLVVLPRSIELTGMPATGPAETDRALRIVGSRGALVFLVSETWHKSEANRSHRARRMVKFRYKPGWLRPEYGRAFRAEYVRRQSEPVRRQLVGGRDFQQPDIDLSAGWRRETLEAEFPVSRFLWI